MASGIPGCGPGGSIEAGTEIKPVFLVEDDAAENQSCPQGSCASSVRMQGRSTADGQFHRAERSLVCVLAPVKRKEFARDKGDRLASRCKITSLRVYRYPCSRTTWTRRHCPLQYKYRWLSRPSSFPHLPSWTTCCSQTRKRRSLMFL
jgi:hypothetical protein